MLLFLVSNGSSAFSQPIMTQETVSTIAFDQSHEPNIPIKTNAVRQESLLSEVSSPLNQVLGRMKLLKSHKRMSSVCNVDMRS
jgi:hypothetical protein